MPNLRRKTLTDVINATSNCNRNRRKLIRNLKPMELAASSSTVPGIDFTALDSAIAKNDSNGVKEALDRLREVGWATKWSSQPYVSRRTTSLRELTSLGIKNAKNLAIPSTRNDEVLADGDEEAQSGSSGNQEVDLDDELMDDPNLESSDEDGFESAFHGTELGEGAEGDEE